MARFGRAGGTLLVGAYVAVSFAVLVPRLTACSSSPSCGVAEFEVYQPGVDSTGIPLCTASTDSAVFVVDSGFGSSFPENFPGSLPLLSDAGATECAVLCAGASSTARCCISVWQPNTFLCTPQCVPQ